MLATLFAMLIILAIAAGVIGMVFVGMEGIGRHRLPEVAHTLARAGAHLNGQGEPPPALVALLEEAEAAGDIRAIPAALRARRSARSAATGSSAASPPSASEAPAEPLGATPTASSHQAEDVPTIVLPALPIARLQGTQTLYAWGDEPLEALEDKPRTSAPAATSKARSAWSSWVADEQA